MKGSGKGGSSKKGRKKQFKRRDRENSQQQNRVGEPAKSKGRRAVDLSVAADLKFTRKRVSSVERPKWASPQPPALNLPSTICIWCDKPIREFSTAVSDPETGKSVHFDCAINRIAERETLEKDDTVGYIGGGRFGIIHFNNQKGARKFRIKKVFEWEDKEARSEWRVALCEHFSVT